MNFEWGKFYKSKDGMKLLYIGYKRHYGDQFTDCYTEEYCNYGSQIECEWVEPKPKKKVKLYAYLTQIQCHITGMHFGKLDWYSADSIEVIQQGAQIEIARVPSEDKEIEVDE